MNNNFFLIETHFGVSGHSIKARTRNLYTQSQINILIEIVNLIYPDEIIEIYFEPPENGSYKDTIKVVGGGVSAIIFGVYSILAYYDSKEANYVSTFESCLNIINEDNLTEKIKKSCESVGIKKQKNDLFKSVIEDPEVKFVQTVIKNKDRIISFDKKIIREDFSNYLEDIPQVRECTKIDMEGYIELAQPYILKQNQYGPGRPWSGIYYGENLHDEFGVSILENGHSVDFFMQDSDYKDQVYNKVIKFESGDNISVTFDMSAKTDESGHFYKSRRIYVKKVKSQNDNIIKHKQSFDLKKIADKNKTNNFGQGQMF